MTTLPEHISRDVALGENLYNTEGIRGVIPLREKTMKQKEEVVDENY